MVVGFLKRRLNTTKTHSEILLHVNDLKVVVNPDPSSERGLLTFQHYIRPSELQILLHAIELYRVRKVEFIADYSKLIYIVYITYTIYVYLCVLYT